MAYRIKEGEGFTIVRNQLWGIEELSNNARLLFIIGLSFRGYQTITTEMLMRRLNVARATYYKAQSELIKYGLLEVEYEKRNGCIVVSWLNFIENPNEWRVIKEHNEQYEKERVQTLKIISGLKDKWK